MFQMLTDMATLRALLEAAERESAAMGERDPGVEHVVLAALGLPDGTAADALADLGVDAERLREAIEQVHSDALAAVGVSEPPPPTPIAESANRGPYRSKGSTRGLLTATADAKKASRSKRFTSAHVLLGASTIEHGTLSQALHLLGIDAVALRSAAQRHSSPRG
jgi:ATP-dependent Clp protease ATP-binding subunit ClpA